VYCDRCGTQLRSGQRFCHTCGKSFQPTPAHATTRTGRVAGNLKALGILWIVYSVFHLLPGLFVATILPFGGPWARHVSLIDWWPGHFIPATILGAVGTFLFITSILGIIAGWGLLERKPWARGLAIAFGILALFNFPFGTALGIYTLWVLASTDAEREYQQAA